ncbi:DUF4402 domain-containing protein [Lacibacterium aquatile]|uniref:DUF4402 domain-containing protein n=1 Tax=Lacibacterium aquatile TaxID=1168082 RepID=A0ABW5DU56_9PROT
MRAFVYPLLAVAIFYSGKAAADCSGFVGVTIQLFAGLDFGTIVQPAGAATVNITRGNTRTATGTTTVGSTYARAHYQTKSASNNCVATVSISPTTVSLENENGATMSATINPSAINGHVRYPVMADGVYPFIFDGLNHDLRIGGTLTLNPGQDPGTYNATVTPIVTVTVN